MDFELYNFQMNSYNFQREDKLLKPKADNKGHSFPVYFYNRKYIPVIFYIIVRIIPVYETFIVNPPIADAVQRN